MADLQTEQFLQDLLESNTKRFIAATLGEIEAFTGRKDARVSQLVKDFSNRSKRALYSALTGVEVESAHEG